MELKTTFVDLNDNKVDLTTFKGKKIETIVGTITWDSEQIINKLKIL